MATQHISEDVEDEPVYTAIEQKMMDEARELSPAGRLSELRKRLIIIAVAVIVWNLYFLLLCRLIIGNTP